MVCVIGLLLNIIYCFVVFQHYKMLPSPFHKHSRDDWLVGLEELFNFRAPAFPEVRSAVAANRDLIDGPSPVSVLSLPLLRPGVCCKIGL